MTGPTHIENIGWLELIAGVALYVLASIATLALFALPSLLGHHRRQRAAGRNKSCDLADGSGVKGVVTHFGSVSK